MSLQPKMFALPLCARGRPLLFVRGLPVTDRYSCDSLRSLPLPSSLCVRVAKTQRSKRALAARAPRLHEAARRSLFLRGSRPSRVVQSLLRGLHILQQPHSVALHKQHAALHPFDDASSLEFLSSKADASLFAVGSGSKKRPHCVVLGRTFDMQVLDMIEYAVQPEGYAGMEAFEGVRKATVRVGGKPCVVFQGDWWERGGDDWAVQRSVWLDLLKGPLTTNRHRPPPTRGSSLTAPPIPSPPLRGVLRCAQ